MKCAFCKKTVALWLLMLVFLWSGMNVLADPIGDNVSSTGDDNISEWDEEWNIVTGRCGGNMEWVLDTSTGELKISGSGSMWSRTAYTDELWNADEVKNVSFEGSITSIGAEAFSGSARMTSVKLPSTVRKIGKSAFESCASLGRIDIAGQLESIGNSCFKDCGNLSDIYCTGSRNDWEALTYGVQTGIGKNVKFHFSNPVYMGVQYASPQKAGTTVKLTVTSTGGSQKLQYKFYSECGGIWTKLWDYSDRSTYNWHATTVGTHTLYCDVKDEKGKVYCARMQYRIEKGTAFVADLNANRISGQYTGTEIRLLADSFNGSGEVRYKFYLEKGGVWVRLKDFSTQDYYLWTPEEPGFYNLYVDAKDADGRLASKRLCFTVEEGNPLRIKSLTAAPENPSAGESVRLIGATTGGQGPVTYKFYYKLNGSWVRIRDFASTPECSFTPAHAGTYQIYMDAIDGKKNTVCKMINLTVS